MKKIIRMSLYVGGIFLLGANVILFVSGITISEKINELEARTKKLYHENIDLETAADKIGSLEYVASQAAVMGFTQKAKSLYLKSSEMARGEY